MRELPVVALRKRGMRWRWAVGRKKRKMMRQKRGLQTAKKHQISIILYQISLRTNKKGGEK